jgi:hypothetical protein
VRTSWLGRPVRVGPPPTGTNNAVRDLNTGQCAVLGGNTEAGGDVTSPGDND